MMNLIANAKTELVMKQTLIYIGAALAIAFSLTSCQKEIQDPEENNAVKKGTSFEIIANPVETRTANDGMATKWSAGDGINVFHAVSGSTTYVSDGEFTIAEADLETNKFKGDVSEELTEEAYDWYLFYPYDEHLTTPANETFYTPIGSQKSGVQTQEGNNSMAHLAGTNYPLFGKISKVAANTTPSFSVNQGCSFIEVTVTNNTESELSISQIQFKAPEFIVGTYYINFSDPENVVYTPSQSGANVFASETAKLVVNNGAAIATGASAKFYMGIKPFTAASGNNLEISVNDYVKVISLTKATTFSAGKIKKINFNYDKEDYVFTEEQFELASSVAPGDRIIITSGSTGDVNVMKHYEGSNNNYKVVAASVSDGIITTTEDMAVLTVGGETGKLTLYDGATMYYLNATNTTSSNYLKASASVDEYAKWKVEFSSKAAVITNQGKTSRNIVRYNKGDALFSCYSTGQADVYIFKKVKTLSSITLENPAPTVFYEGDTFSYDGTVIANYEDGTTEDVTTLATFTYDLSTTGAKQVEVSYKGKTASYDITVNAKPVLVFEKTIFNISNDVTNGGVEYSINNSIDGNLQASCESDADWLTVGDYYLYDGPRPYQFYSAAKNEGTERSGHLTFTYPHADPVVVTIIQAKADDYVEPTTTTLMLTRDIIHAAHAMGNGSYGDYKDKDVDLTIGEIGFTAQNICSNSKNGTYYMAAGQYVQFKKETGYLYNTTSLNLKSIKIWTLESAGTGVVVNTGSAKNPSTVATVTSTSSETFTVLDNNNNEVEQAMKIYEVALNDGDTYFKLVPSTALWVYKMEIEYE